MYFLYFFKENKAFQSMYIDGEILNIHFHYAEITLKGPNVYFFLGWRE